MNGHIKNKSHYTILRDPQDLAKPKENDKAGDEYNAGMRRYGMSKTIMVLWMYELQRRLSASKQFSNLSVLGIDPGAMTDTELFRDSPLFLRIVLSWAVGPTRAKSAHDLLVACFDENDVLGKSPKAVHLNRSEVVGTSAETRDEAKQKRLWEASVEISGARDEETPPRLRYGPDTA